MEDSAIKLRTNFMLILVKLAKVENKLHSKNNSEIISGKNCDRTKLCTAIKLKKISIFLKD